MERPAEEGRYAEKVEGEWLTHKLEFFRAPNSKNVWYALAGVDVEAPPGPSKLTISARLYAPPNNGQQAEDLSQNILIHTAHYRTGREKST